MHTCRKNSRFSHFPSIMISASFLSPLSCNKTNSQIQASDVIPSRALCKGLRPELCYDGFANPPDLLTVSSLNVDLNTVS